jgi:hypothetical protein
MSLSEALTNVCKTDAKSITRLEQRIALKNESVETI